MERPEKYMAVNKFVLDQCPQHDYCRKIRGTYSIGKTVTNGALSSVNAISISLSNTRYVFEVITTRGTLLYD